MGDEHPRIEHRPGSEDTVCPYEVKFTEHGTRYGICEATANRWRDQLCKLRGLPVNSQERIDHLTKCMRQAGLHAFFAADADPQTVGEHLQRVNASYKIAANKRVRELEDAEVGILAENDELHTKIDQLTEDTPMHIAVHQQASQEHTRLTKALLERAGLELTDLVVDDGQTLVERLLSLIVVTRVP